jgi:hypothetical protein
LIKPEADRTENDKREIEHQLRRFFDGKVKAGADQEAAERGEV